MANYSLYFIADNSFCDTNTLITTVHQISDCGISLVQLRMKSAAKEEIIKTGEQLLKILRPKKIPLIINDQPDVVAAIDADGVHLGQNDIDYEKARVQIGPHKIIGLSIENLQQTHLCRHWNVDYFGVGPVFKTHSKLDAAKPIGLVGLKNIVSLSPKPVVAIGGINAQNAADVLATGVSGVAVISAILATKSPILAATQLNKIISDYQNQHE